jgi:hypothetical protein
MLRVVFREHVASAVVVVVVVVVAVLSRRRRRRPEEKMEHVFPVKFNFPRASGQVSFPMFFPFCTNDADVRCSCTLKIPHPIHTLSGFDLTTSSNLHL